MAADGRAVPVRPEDPESGDRHPGCRREPGKTDTQLLDWLAQIGIPRIIAVTKCDKLSNADLAKQVRLIAQGLALPHEELVLFSAKTHQGRDTLWRAISNLMASVKLSCP